MTGPRFRLTMYAPAPDGMVYLNVAADGLAGRELPISVLDDPILIGTIEEAVVVDDGKAVKLTVSVRNMPPELRKLLEYGGKTPGDA